MSILARARKFFQRKEIVTTSKADFSGLSAAGAGVKKPENIPVSAVVTSAPVLDREPIIMRPEAVTAPALCPHCKQPMPEKPAAPVASDGPSVLDADWNSLERTDLEPRTPSQIAALIPFETEAMREKRIISDKMRWLRQQGR